MYKVSSQAIKVFASGVCIPVKASYSVAIVSYALMECCPVSARMRNAGGPFLLEWLGILGHILFINSGCASSGFNLNKSTLGSWLRQSFS